MNLPGQPSFIARNHRLLFYSLWLFLGLFQAGLTELQDDEAYYWVFSQFPDWGYYDHPPLTAMLVKFGYALLPNELGIRLFPLLLNVGSLLIIEQLLSRKNSFLFYPVVLSIVVLQLAGFMAVPDTPLIFFTALFFLIYKKFCARQSVINIFLLAISIACLFYTKYHAILVILFTLASNPRLLRNPRAWLVVLLTLVLFFPHLQWQYRHNWISFRYHLFESNRDPYKVSYTLEFIIGQFLFAGPIAGFILLPASFLYTPRDLLEKALKWVMLGTYLFFFASSFFGAVEVNWTSAVLVPIIVLSCNSLNERSNWRQWLLRTLPFTLMLTVFGRIVIIEDLLPLRVVKERYHAWKKWPEALTRITKNTPVVFSNSYQRASKFWFYSKKMTYSQNHVMSRKNNYNFWLIEELLVRKPVYYMDIYDLHRFTDTIQAGPFTIGYRYDSLFASFSKVIFLPLRQSYTVTRGDSLILEGTVRMGSHYSALISDNPDLSATIKLFIFDGKKIIKELLLPLELNDLLEGNFHTWVDPGLKPGSYHAVFSIHAEGGNPTHNSEKIGLIIRSNH